MHAHALADTQKNAHIHPIASSAAESSPSAAPFQYHLTSRSTKSPPWKSGLPTLEPLSLFRISESTADANTLPSSCACAVLPKEKVFETLIVQSGRGHVCREVVIQVRKAVSIFGCRKNAMLRKKIAEMCLCAISLLERRLRYAKMPKCRKMKNEKLSRLIFPEREHAEKEESFRCNVLSCGCGLGDHLSWQTSFALGGLAELRLRDSAREGSFVIFFARSILPGHRFGASNIVTTLSTSGIQHESRIEDTIDLSVVGTNPVFVEEVAVGGAVTTIGSTLPTTAGVIDQRVILEASRHGSRDLRLLGLLRWLHARSRGRSGWLSLQASQLVSTDLSTDQVVTVANEGKERGSPMNW
jgi:hypothetical protein